MAAELKIGIGADISSLTKAVSDAKGKIGDLSNIKLPEIKAPKVEMPKMIPMPPMPEIPPIKIPPIPPIKIPPIDDKAVDDFLAKVDKIKGVGEGLSDVGQKMTVGLTLPILALGGSAVKAYGDIQSLQKGLEAVMGSAGSASKEFERLKEVAKLPGLGMQEAVRGSINLQAIGLSADKSRGILQQFGNAVASVGKGKAEFERAIYGVQQLANTDFPLGEDLNIIKDALPQVSNLLKEAFGSSRSDELAKMGVSSKQVLDTITAGLEKLPRVTGGINGAFENLGDSMKTSLARIGKIIDDTFDISGIIDKLTGYLDTAISAFESLSPAIQKSILVITGLVAAAGPLLVVVGGFLAALPTMLTGIGAIGAALTALTGPIGLVVIGIGAIIAAVVTNWGKIKPYILNTINYFRELYNESTIVRIAVAGIATTFKNSFAIVSNILKTAWEIFKTFAKATADLFAGVGTVLKGALTGDLGAIKGGLVQMSAAWSSGISSLSKDLGNGIKGLYNDISKNFSDGMAMVTNNQKLKPVTDLKIFDEEKIADSTAKAATNGVAKGLAKAKESVGVALLDFGKSFKQNTVGFIIPNPLDSLFSEDQIKAFEDRMAEYTPRLITPLTNAQIAMQEQGIRFQEAIEGLIGEGVVEGLSQAFEAMGGAIAQGGNILQAAGGAILGVLGQFMQMLGKEMIKLAVATIALGSLVSGIKKFIIANPGAAIALAGVAIVAGTLLSAAGGNIGGGSSGSGGGSVPSGGGNSSQSYSSTFSSGGAGGDARVVFEISGNNLLGVLDRARDKNTRLGG